jgi:hypothetical protein
VARLPYDHGHRECVSNSLRVSIELTRREFDDVHFDIAVSNPESCCTRDAGHMSRTDHSSNC